MATASDNNVAASQVSAPSVFAAGTFSLQLGMSLLMLSIAAIAWLANSLDWAVSVAILGFIVNTSLVVIEIHSVLTQKGKLAPLLIIGGTLFWFIIDATVLALGDVPFTSRYPLYPYFASGIPADVVGKTLFGVYMFQVCGLLGLQYVRIPERTIARWASRKDILSGTSMDLVCLLITLLPYIPFAILAGDWTQTLSRLVEMRNSETSVEFAGGDPGLSIHLCLLGIFGGSVATARFLLGLKGSNTVRLTSVAVTAIWVFLSGTRFLVIFLILPSLVLLTNQSAGRAKSSRLRLRLLAVAAIAALAIFVQAAIRNVGVDGYSSYERTSDVIRGGAVGYEHFEAMAIAIDLSDREDVQFHEFMLPVVIRHFIPRMWWPEKPDWESWAFYNDAVTSGAGSFNVTPSVTGEYYLNWGLWGIIFIGFFFGWLGRCCDEWLGRVSFAEGFSGAVFCGFFLGFLFVSYRILSPIYIAYIVGAAIVLVMLTRPGERMPRAMSR